MINLVVVDFLFNLTTRVCARSVTSVVSDSSQPYGPQPVRLLCPRDSSGENTGVGHHALLQGILPTRGLNPCLLHLLRWLAGGFFTTRATWEALYCVQGCIVTTVFLVCNSP